MIVSIIIIIYDYDDAHDHARWLLSFARLGVGSLAVICVFSVIQSRLEVLMLLLPLLFGVVALTPPPPTKYVTHRAWVKPDSQW